MSRRFPMVIALAFALVAAALASESAVAPAGAQDDAPPPIVNGGANVLVVQTGVSRSDIRDGASTGPTGPVYRCDLLAEEAAWEQPVAWSAAISGDYYGRNCQSDTGPPIIDVIQYFPGDPSDGLGVTEIEVRNWLIDNNRLVPPGIQVEVSPAGQQITGVETWIWLPGDRIDGPATASAGAIEVSVRATLEELRINPGEPIAEAFTCEDFSEWSSAASEPLCSHTYLTEPETGDSFRLTTEAKWRFEWYRTANPVWDPFGFVFPPEAQDIEVVDLEAVITR